MEILPRLLSTEVWSQFALQHATTYYRPVFSLWLLIVYTFAGHSTFLWHLASILLHVITTFLVFKFAEKFVDSRIAASFAALLFAIYPIHIEDISYISAVNEILYTGFALCSFLCLLHWTRQQRSIWIWFSLAAWSAALFAKETAIVLLPLLLLLAFRGSSRKEWRNRLKVALAYVAVAVVYLAVRSMVLHNLLGTTSWSAPWSQVLATAPFAMVFYLRKLVIPTGLSPFYMIGLQTKASPQVWLTAVAILLGIALVAWRRSAWRVAASLILLPLVPAIAGIHFFYGTGLIEHTETVHDRYLYLPSVGLALILALLAKYLWSRSRNVSLVLGLLLIVACIGLNVTQQDFYRSEASLFTHVFKGAGVRPEELGTYMLVAAGTACKTGLPEEARELLNVDRLALVRRDGIVISGIVSFQGTLGDRSFEFDAQDGNIKYLTPQMVLRTVPSADVALDLTACLNYPVMPNR